MPESEWDTESGLETDYDGTVVDAWFEEGDYGCTLKLVVDSPTLDSDVENWYGCGKKVQLISDTEVDLSANKGGKFNTNSAVGQLIRAIVDAELTDQVGKEGPANAQSFKGLSAHWEVKEFSTKIDGETKTYTRTLPVGPPRSAEAKAKAEKADEPEIPKWLITLCSEHESYDDFLDAALKDERLDKALRAIVLNEEYWDFS